MILLVLKNLVYILQKGLGFGVQGLGDYDQSDKAEEGQNFALMAYAYSSSGSDSEVSNDYAFL